MNDGLHIDDALLNEYLDAVLAPDRRAEVEAHLAQCSDCAARLSDLRSLFAALEAMPDAPLARDLSVAVIAAFRRPRLQNPVAHPALRIALAVQAFAALVLLGAAAPFVVRAPQWVAASQFGERATSAIATAVTGFTSEWLAAPAAAQRTMSESFEMLRRLTLPPLPWQNVGLCLSAVALLWLLGNGLLLRPPRERPQASHSRSH